MGSLRLKEIICNEDDMDEVLDKFQYVKYLCGIWTRNYFGMGGLLVWKFRFGNLDRYSIPVFELTFRNTIWLKFMYKDLLPCPESCWLLVIRIMEFCGSFYWHLLHRNSGSHVPS